MIFAAHAVVISLTRATLAKLAWVVAAANILHKHEAAKGDEDEDGETDADLHAQRCLLDSRHDVAEVVLLATRHALLLLDLHGLCLRDGHGNSLSHGLSSWRNGSSLPRAAEDESSVGAREHNVIGSH